MVCPHQRFERNLHCSLQLRARCGFVSSFAPSTVKLDLAVRCALLRELRKVYHRQFADRDETQMRRALHLDLLCRSSAPMPDRTPSSDY